MKLRMEEQEKSQVDQRSWGRMNPTKESALTFAFFSFFMNAHELLSWSQGPLLYHSN